MPRDGHSEAPQGAVPRVSVGGLSLHLLRAERSDRAQHPRHPPPLSQWLCINPEHLVEGSQADNKHDDWANWAYGVDPDWL